MANINSLLLVLILIGTHSCEKINQSPKVSCRIEGQGDVDWYYLYKLPKHFSLHPEDSSGLRYLYISSNTVNKGWTFSTFHINQTDSTPGQTLDHIFQNSSVLLLAYNDEDPSGPVDNTNGHTKGVLATDGQTGFWLIHSVPKYPSIPNYDYPTTGEHFGQSFLCISLDSEQMDAIGEQLLFNEPNIYFSRVPESLKGSYMNIESAIEKQWRKSGPFNNEIELQSAGGTVFKSFAKGRKFNKELYEDWIAPILDTDLYAETWRNGPGALPSNCSLKERVYNIKTVESEALNLSFKSSTDHSKWAVSSLDNNNWICVGDINRAEHQLLRGGGSVCQNNSNLAPFYKQLIKSFENCSN